MSLDDGFQAAVRGAETIKRAGFRSFGAGDKSGGADLGNGNRW